MRNLSRAHYREEADFRHQLACFRHAWHLTADHLGLTAKEYDLMLVIRGARRASEMGIGDVARRLLTYSVDIDKFVHRLETQIPATLSRALETSGVAAHHTCRRSRAGEAESYINFDSACSQAADHTFFDTISCRICRSSASRPPGVFSRPFSSRNRRNSRSSVTPLADPPIDALTGEIEQTADRESRLSSATSCSWSRRPVVWKSITLDWS